MAVTLKDVAGLAGVDIAAVSRTLRGDPRAGELREETCERILRCAKELGYHRNMSASTIRMGYNASTVSLIYSPGMLGFQSHLFQIISLANSKGLGVRPVTDEDLDGLFAELEANQIRYVLCSSEHVDRREKIAEFCAGTGRRVVFLGADPVVGRPSIQVSFDYYGGMRMLVRHLVRLGHRRIALYCGPHAHECPRLLHQGFLDEIAGSEGASGFTSCEEYSADELLRLIRQSRATALCTIDNSIGILAENDLFRAGIEVPDDLSLVSIGGGALAEFSLAPQTHIEEPLNGIAETALDCLIHSRKMNKRILLEGILRERSSCRPLSIEKTSEKDKK